MTIWQHIYTHESQRKNKIIQEFGPSVYPDDLFHLKTILAD